LSMAGNIGKEWTIQWQAHLNDLSALLPTLKGNLLSQGKILGQRNKPRIQAYLSASDLKTNTFSTNNVSAKVEFNLESLDNSQVEIKAQQNKSSNYEISDLTLLGKMKETKKGVLLSLNLKPGKFQYPLESVIKTETFSGGFWNTLFTENTIN